MNQYEIDIIKKIFFSSSNPAGCNATLQNIWFKHQIVLKEEINYGCQWPSNSTSKKHDYVVTVKPPTDLKAWPAMDHKEINEGIYNRNSNVGTPSKPEL